MFYVKFNHEILNDLKFLLNILCRFSVFIGFFIFIIFILILLEIFYYLYENLPNFNFIKMLKFIF